MNYVLDEGVKNYLNALDFTVTQAKNPYQFFLEHPDIKGRYAWYPTTGSLVYEDPNYGSQSAGTFPDVDQLIEKMMLKTKV
jgi:hypothetical protein